MVGLAVRPGEEGMVQNELTVTLHSIAGHGLHSNSPGAIGPPFLMMKDGIAMADFWCNSLASTLWERLVGKRRSVQIISVPAFLHLAHGRKSLHLALLSLHGTHAAAALDRWAIRRALRSSAASCPRCEDS